LSVGNIETPARKIKFKVGKKVRNNVLETEQCHFVSTQLRIIVLTTMFNSQIYLNINWFMCADTMWGIQYRIHSHTHILTYNNTMHMFMYKSNRQ